LLSFNRILPRLIVGFILVAVLPLTALFWVISVAYEQALERSVLAGISSIADKKSDLINSYLDERMEDGYHLSYASATQIALDRFVNTPLHSSGWETEAEHYQNGVISLFEKGGFYDLLLIDGKGNVVFSIRREEDLGSNLYTGSLQHSALSRAHYEAVSLLTQQITRAENYAPSKDVPAIFIVTPIINNAQAIGSIALQLDLDRLTRITSDFTGLGTTGETVLAQKNKNDVLYVAPLRHVENAAFRYHAPWQQTAPSLQDALAGGRDAGLSYDYTNENVMAAWRYLPAIGWGMVVKMDSAEALAPVYQLRRYGMIILTVILILAGVIALKLGQSLLLPIRQLTLCTWRMGQGDYDQRIPLAGCDEFRQLAGSFNDMAQEIQNERAMLERRVNERTAELLESKLQYQELTTRIPVGVFMAHIDDNGNMAFRYVSPRLCEILQIGETLILEDSQWLFDCVHPDDCESLFNLVHKVHKTLEPFLWEGRFNVQDETRWLRIESFGKRLDNGDSVWNGVLSDISQSKYSEIEYHLILETALDGFWINDLQGRFVDVNNSYCQMIGYSREELLSMSIPDIEAIEDPEETAKHIKNLLQVGYDRFETSHRHKDGRLLSIEVSANYLPMAGGKFIVFLRDISERKQIVTQLREALTVAEVANRTKSEFLANMSHEIRTPMNAIMGLTRLVLESGLSDRQHDLLNKAYTSSRALLGILNDILDYSKIEAGGLKIEEEPLVLEDFLGDLSDLFAARLEEKGLELFIEIAPDVPFRILTDPLRLSQILNNLVGNAIKFTDSGNVHIKVETIAGSASGDEMLVLHFMVRDTGIGLSQEQTERLFQPFTQADSGITRRYGGTGLGLAICNKLLKLMGGEIGVSSQLGQGATFYFTVPVRSQTMDCPERDLHGIKGLKALVVDDQPIARQLLGDLLQAWGLSVVTANDGLSALQLIEECAVTENPFDILLLDWRMPGLDGLEVARRLADHELAPPLRIIMVTMHDRDELLSESKDLKFNGLLTKPVIPSRLFDLLMHRHTFMPTKRTMPRRHVQFPGAQVLLAEDNHLNQQVAAEFLQQHGITVTIANNGEEAVALAQQQPFDLVLMDLHMPKMDGFAATRQILALPGETTVPVIAMTAAVMPEDRQYCSEIGMVGFVAKPIDPDELIQVLDQWLKKYQIIDNTQSTIRITNESWTIEEAGLPGLDLIAALRRIGNRQRVIQLLAQFATDEQQTDQMIAALIDSGNRSEALERLHAIKGTAANLGLTRLATASADFEHELKHANTTTHMAEFKDALQMALTSIHELQKLTDHAQAPPSEVDRQRVFDLIAQLEPYLRERELPPDELIEQLRESSHCAGTIGELMTQLVRYIDLFDYESALRTCLNIDAA
jgi:two-component system, sensor histidine kinase and response regulator